LLYDNLKYIFLREEEDLQIGASSSSKSVALFEWRLHRRVLLCLWVQKFTCFSCLSLCLFFDSPSISV